MASELRFRVRVLAFGQPGEVLIANRTIPLLLGRPCVHAARKQKMNTEDPSDRRKQDPV
jgi:hypothetical protein